MKATGAPGTTSAQLEMHIVEFKSPGCRPYRVYFKDTAFAFVIAAFTDDEQ